MIAEQMSTPDFISPHSPDSLQAELAYLEHRLDRGWRMIEDYKSAGRDVSELEEHFIGILDQYEQLYSRIHD